MVRLSAVVIAMAGALVGLTTADNYKNGIYYCSYNLLAKGLPPSLSPLFPLSQKRQWRLTSRPRQLLQPDRDRAAE